MRRSNSKLQYLVKLSSESEAWEDSDDRCIYDRVHISPKDREASQKGKTPRCGGMTELTQAQSPSHSREECNPWGMNNRTTSSTTCTSDRWDKKNSSGPYFSLDVRGEQVIKSLLDLLYIYLLS